jgi:WxL domain surface cell wall-binding
MGLLLGLTSRRTTRLLAASALLIGVGGATMAASSASAAACDPAVFAQTCTAPATQTWGTTLDGTDKQLVDAAPADTSFSVQDATGSGDGWNVTATATQFTVGASTTVLADTGTLVFNGSATSETTGATPGNLCAPATTCTVPTTDVVFPVDFVTGAAVIPVSIYNAAAATGLGNILIGSSSGGAPAAWWVNVPASATAGAYVSTITLAINSGPTGTGG